MRLVSNIPSTLHVYPGCEQGVTLGIGPDGDLLGRERSIAESFTVPRCQPHRLHVRGDAELVKARRGYKRAVVAIAHKILVSIYHMFSQQVSYNDLGHLYLDKLKENHLTRNLVHRPERLGYSVTLTLQQIAA